MSRTFSENFHFQYFKSFISYYNFTIVLRVINTQIYSQNVKATDITVDCFQYFILHPHSNSHFIWMNGTNGKGTWNSSFQKELPQPSGAFINMIDVNDEVS